MNQSLATSKRKNPDAETREREAREWLRAVERQVLTTVRSGGYGTLRVEIVAGHVKRAVLERSLVRPEQLDALVELEEVAPDP